MNRILVWPRPSPLRCGAERRFVAKRFQVALSRCISHTIDIASPSIVHARRLFEELHCRLRQRGSPIAAPYRSYIMYAGLICPASVDVAASSHMRRYPIELAIPRNLQRYFPWRQKSLPLGATPKAGDGERLT